MKKYRFKTYTAFEVQSALNALTKMLERKLEDRKEINRQIRKIKENIKFYEELDMSQTRLDI